MKSWIIGLIPISLICVIIVGALLARRRHRRFMKNKLEQARKAKPVARKPIHHQPSDFQAPAVRGGNPIIEPKRDSGKRLPTNYTETHDAIEEQQRSNLVLMSTYMDTGPSVADHSPSPEPSSSHDHGSSYGGDSYGGSSDFGGGSSDGGGAGGDW